MALDLEQPKRLRATRDLVRPAPRRRGARCARRPTHGLTGAVLRIRSAVHLPTMPHPHSHTQVAMVPHCSGFLIPSRYALTYRGAYAICVAPTSHVATSETAQALTCGVGRGIRRESETQTARLFKSSCLASRLSDCEIMPVRSFITHQWHARSVECLLCTATGG